MSGSLADRSLSAVSKTRRGWMMRLAIVNRMRHRDTSSADGLVYRAANLYFFFRSEEAKLLKRKNRISLAKVSFNFNGFSDHECLSYFRFTKQDLQRVVKAVNWPSYRTHNLENRYATDEVLGCCVLRRRFSAPSRWWDLELFFGKHAPQLSESFWETLEWFVSTRGCFLRGCSSVSFVCERMGLYPNAIYSKSDAFEHYIGFLDRTVIGIARPSETMWQRVAYNGHKRKHALKFQSVVTPDGLILDAFGPGEGRRHDWALYVRSELEERLPVLLDVDGIQYCIDGDYGYSERWYLRVPFQGSALSAAQKALNKAMSAMRATVEWVFKEIKVYWPVLDYKRKL